MPTSFHLNVLPHALTWLCLYVFWVFVSRKNHPTLTLNLVATGMMLGTYAGVTYMNRLVLVPRFWREKRFAAYFASLLMGMILLTVAVVFAIQLFYDLLWGPDANRFGFWTNFTLDFAGMLLHLLLTVPIFQFHPFVKSSKGNK